MYIVINFNVFHTCIVCRSSTSLTLLAKRRRRLDRAHKKHARGKSPSSSTRRAQSSPHDACGLNRSLFLHPCTGLCAARYGTCAAFSPLGKPCKTLQRSLFFCGPIARLRICLSCDALPALKRLRKPAAKDLDHPLIVYPGSLARRSRKAAP